MKNTLRFGLILAALTTCSVLGNGNQIQVGYSGSSFGPFPAGTEFGTGGEFTINPMTSWLNTGGYVDNGMQTANFGVPGTFQTFCVEIQESIGGYPNTYGATLNIGATKGGVGGLDVLSVGTGWLYCRFATGKLDGYSYGFGDGARKASAAELQKAIWWLEDEITLNEPMDNMFLSMVAGAFSGLSAAKLDGASAYGVFALNVTYAGNDMQDVIVYIPDGGLTLALLGFGFVGIETLRRKLKA